MGRFFSRVLILWESFRYPFRPFLPSWFGERALALSEMRAKPAISLFLARFRPFFYDELYISLIDSYPSFESILTLWRSVGDLRSINYTQIWHPPSIFYCRPLLAIFDGGVLPLCLNLSILKIGQIGIFCFCIIAPNFPVCILKYAILNYLTRLHLLIVNLIQICKLRQCFRCCKSQI